MKRFLAIIILLCQILAGCSGEALEAKDEKPSIPKLEEPFFPLGWYASLVREDLKGISDQGGNFAITYVLTGRLKKEQLSDYLDEAERKSIKVLLDITADWKWFDDDMPIPSDPVGSWMWTRELAFSKKASHFGPWTSGKNEHGFVLRENGYPILNVQDHDVIEQWVYIPKDSNVKEIMMEFYAAKDDNIFSWAHRVYWGEDLVEREWKEKKLDAFRAGDLPKERNQWVKLIFNANDIDLDATVVKGVDFVNFGSQVYWDLFTRRTGKERIEERVKYLWEKPALYGWYLCDEPELRNIDPKRLRELYDIVRAADPNPNHIIAPVFQDMKIVDAYSDSCDVIFLDCYPVTCNSRKMDWMTTWVAEGMRIAKKQNKRFVFVPQGFGDCPEYPLWTKPTAHELHWMTWTPIIMGARGICYWAYYKATPEIIKESGVMFGEIKKYQDYLEKGTPVTGLSCNITSDSDNDNVPDVVYSVLEYEGKRLVLISNVTSKKFDNVRLSGPSFNVKTKMGAYDIFIGEYDF